MSKHGLLDGDDIIKLKIYGTYVMVEQYKVQFGTWKQIMKDILEYVHSHLWAPFSIWEPWYIEVFSLCVLMIFLEIGVNVFSPI